MQHPQAFLSRARRSWMFSVTALVLSAITVLNTPAALAADKKTLVIGMDIGDGRTYDPARQADLSPPLTLGAVYEQLVTLGADNLAEVKPMLAASWSYNQAKQVWIFKLKPGVKFWNGETLTAEDVKFSLERLMNVKDQPSADASNLQRVDVIDAQTVEIALKVPAPSNLIDLTGTVFSIYSKKMVEAQGGSSAADAKDKDKATPWLNANSAGSGPYHMVSWERNAQVVLARNPHYHGGAVPFERIVIRHISDGAAQLLAVRRGDIDIAMNLNAEQLDTLAGNKDVSIQKTTSIDTMLMTMTSSPTMNPALAKPEARAAVAAAIDYDGLIKGLVGGFSQRPPSFIPIGAAGVTEATARQLGYKEDLPKARRLLKEAGLADGFTFELIYPNTPYFSTSFQLIAQKIQSDVSRVGIKIELKPMDSVNWRTQFNSGKAQSVLAFWTATAPNPYIWASASVQRLAKRMYWEPSADMMELVDKARAETDLQKQQAMYLKYQQTLIEQANYVMLLQPIYRVAVNKAVSGVELTANIWKMDMKKIRPAK
ncbi:MAG: ABC transporter substrate-binding protein [Bdellovibrionales bacterium]|nr:ABC transporter substrate-binding protein [Ramlibacter sp.]